MKLPTTMRLRTKRCWLRHVSEEDIPHIFSASRYPGFTDGMRWEPPEKADDLIAAYRYNVKAWEDAQAYCFSIEERGSRSFIGRITLRKGDEPDLWDLGFWTHPERQGRGYMTEAVEAMIELGFLHLGASAIIAGYATWNRASARVLEKNGMIFLRHDAEGFIKHGKWVAVNILAISLDRWKETRSQGTAETQ